MCIGAVEAHNLRDEMVGGYRWGLQSAQRAERRAAVMPIVGLAAGISGYERGVGLEGGGDGSRGASGAAGRSNLRG